MKKSAKILLLVLVLSLLCAALVISAVAVAQGDASTVSDDYNGAPFTQISYVDFEDEETDKNLTSGEPEYYSSKAGFATRFIVNEIENNVAKILNGTNENGESNKYFYYTLGAKSSAAGSAPYFNVKTTAGSATVADTAKNESLLNRPLQVLDFDVFVPSWRCVDSGSFIQFNISYYDESTKEKYSEFQTITIPLYNAENVGSFFRTQDGSENRLIIDENAWTHVTVALEAVPEMDGETVVGYTTQLHFFMNGEYKGASTYVKVDKKTDAANSTIKFEGDDVAKAESVYLRQVRINFPKSDKYSYTPGARDFAVDNINMRAFASDTDAAATLKEIIDGNKNVTEWNSSIYTSNYVMPFGHKVASLMRGGVEIGVYDNLQDAVDAAQNGDTILLHRNCAYSTTTNLDAYITIDTQGYTVGTLECAENYTTATSGNIIKVKNSYINISSVDFESATPGRLSLDSNSTTYNDPVGTYKTTFENHKTANISTNIAKINSGTNVNGSNNNYFYYTPVGKTSTSNKPYFWIQTTEGKRDDADTGKNESVSKRPLQILEFDLFTPSGKPADNGDFIQFYLSYTSEKTDGTPTYSSFQTIYVPFYNFTDGGKLRILKDKSKDTLIKADAWTHITLALEILPETNDAGALIGYTTRLHFFFDGEYKGYSDCYKDSKTNKEVFTGDDATTKAESVFLREIRINFPKFNTDTTAYEEGARTFAIDNINLRAYTDTNHGLSEFFTNGKNLTEWNNSIYTTDYVMPFGNAVIKDAADNKYDSSMIAKAMAADKAAGGSTLTLLKDFKGEFKFDYATTITVDPAYTKVKVATPDCPWLLSYDDSGVYTTKRANIVYTLKGTQYWYTKDQDECDFDAILKSILLTTKENGKPGSIELYDYSPTLEITGKHYANVDVTIDLGGNTLNVIMNKGATDYKADKDLGIQVRYGTTFTIKNGTMTVENKEVYNKSYGHYPLFYFSTDGATLTFDNVNTYSDNLVHLYGTAAVPTVKFIGGEHHLVGYSNYNTEGGFVDSRSNIVVEAVGAKFYSISRSNTPFHIASGRCSNVGQTEKKSTLSFTNCSFYMADPDKNIFTMNEFTTVTLNGCYIEGVLDPSKSPNRDSSASIGDPKDGSIILGEGTTLSSKSNVILSSKVALADGMGKFLAPETTLTYNVYSKNDKTFTPKTIEFIPQFTVKSISEGVFKFTNGIYMFYADDSATLADVISRTTNKGEIMFLADYVMTDADCVTIDKGIILNLNGKSLDFSEITKEDSYFTVATADEVTLKNGAIIGASLIFNVSMDKATVSFIGITTDGAKLAYSESAIGTNVNVDGGNYTVADGSVLFDFSANTDVFVIDAVISLGADAYLFTLNGDKNTAVFHNSVILATAADYSISDGMNETTAVEFNACMINGSINTADKALNILLGKDTVFAEGATVDKNLIKMLGGHGLITVNVTHTVGDTVITFTLGVGEPDVEMFVVTWYNTDGTVIKVTYAKAGEVVIPPSYTLPGANGWYKIGYDGWTTTENSYDKVENFTITKDTSFWPARSESGLTPYLSAAQYNLSFTGSVILNFYLPGTPEDVSNVRVYLVDENGDPIIDSPISPVQTWLSRGYYNVYEIASLSPQKITEKIKIKVYFDVATNDATETLIQTVTLSPLRYATNILKDSDNGTSSTWDSKTHTMIADMVRYANYLHIAAKGTDVPELTELLKSYEKICSLLPTSNDFKRVTTSIAGLKDYLNSITFAIGDFSPQWLIEVKEEAKVKELTISVNGYLPTADEETGINFGKVTYSLDMEKSVFTNGYLTTAYVENMPIYNMDRVITVTVTTEDGTTASATYSLNEYYNGISDEARAKYEDVLKAFRAFGISSAFYKYPTVKGESQDPHTCAHESAMLKSNTGLSEGKFCDSCQTYVFFYDDFIEQSGMGGGVYTSRPDAMAGKANSFGSIDACHAAANNKSLADCNVICVATPGSYYYIQRPNNDINGDNTITIYNDTSWTGAYIISDESMITYTDDEWGDPLFTVKGNDVFSGKVKWAADGTNIRTSLSSGVKKGAETLGSFKPGIPMMVKLTDSSVKHYIRTGSNTNNGSDQTEVILVDENGNVDPSTPIEWNYTYSSKFSAYAYPVNYDPITISGLDENGNITATYENNPNCYVAKDKWRHAGRGFTVMRSNVTVEGIYHEFNEITGTGTFRQSYTFMNSELASKVTFKDMSLVHHYGRELDSGSDIGSYEFGSKLSIDITWINCRQRNFFTNSTGKLGFRGVFGTNTSRNMYLRDCFLNSFDSHSAAYNVTIENSTFEHLNFIGAGDVVLTDVTLYLNSNGGICLRSDYGSRWNGNFYIDGLELRYDPQNFSNLGYKRIELIRASYEDHNFGYNGVNHRPEEIHVNNVSIWEYSRTENANVYEFDENGKLIESNIKAGTYPLVIYYSFNEDLTDIGYNPQGYEIVCTKAIYFTHDDDHPMPSLDYPDNEFFKDMKIYINGEEQNWYKG